MILISNSSEQKFTLPENITEKKIESFLNLSNGWHFGAGHPPSIDTVTQALSVLHKAQSYSLKTDAIPGIDGEIQIICFNKDDTLEFTIEKIDKITIVLERGGQEVIYREEQSLKEALKQLTNYGKEICNLSESSTNVTTSNTLEDLAIWHSRTPPTQAEYRLF